MTSSALFFALTYTFIVALIFLIFAFEMPFKNIDKTEGKSYMEHDAEEPIHYKKAA